MSTTNPTAVSYAGQFSNQTLPIVAFGAALRALRSKMGMIKWCRNKDFAGANSQLGAQIPIPYVGRIEGEDVTPGATPNSATSLNNSTRFMVMNNWVRSKPFALSGQEMSIFETSSLVPRSLERSIQCLAEGVEGSAFDVAYKFPAVAGTANTSAFASNVAALADLRLAMSLNLCPNSEDVALFLSSTDAWTLKKTDDFKKNPQLAGLAIAQEQYGKAVFGEIMSAYIFENQFIGTRTPGNYGSATIKLSAASAGAMTVTANASANCVLKAGDSWKIACSDAPEGYIYTCVATAANLTANTAASVTITQPLEWSIAANAAATCQNTDAQGYAPYENLAITPDALAIANRILICGDIAEATGNAFHVTDDQEDGGTGLTFTLKAFPGSYQKSWEASLFFAVDVADCRLGGRLLSRGTSLS